MNRRGFLGSILAAAVAPAIVRADSLMRIVPMETEVLVPYEQHIIINQMRGDLSGKYVWNDQLKPAWDAMLRDNINPYWSDNHGWIKP